MKISQYSAEVSEIITYITVFLGDAIILKRRNVFNVPQNQLRHPRSSFIAFQIDAKNLTALKLMIITFSQAS